MKIKNVTFLAAALFIMPFTSQAQDTWPRKFSTDWAKLIVYQPQTDSAKGDHLYSRAAISIITKTNKSPAFGAIWMDAKLVTDKEKGICTVSQVKLINVRFPRIDTLNASEVKRFDSLVEKEASKWKMEYSLEELKSASEIAHAAGADRPKLKNDPPEIIFLDQPSFLVLFDGDPIWKESGSEGLQIAVNTPYLVLRDTRENSCYLHGDQLWYSSQDPVKSQWTSVPKPSAQVLHYLDAQKKEAVKSGKPAEQIKKKSAKGRTASPLEIVVRTRPSELIQSEGEPQFAPIKGTQLLYMTNTDNNIFMTIDKNQYYVLLSGRWYRTEALSGGWAYIAPDKLPADFAKIPKGSEKDVVLASVAGTDVAKKAVLDAQIPKTAAVNRKTAKCEVKWDGDPKFEMIKGTELARGMNTSGTVLLLKDTYYVCDNAIWFTGKGPSGPWEVATSVPAEVQKIPPDDPAYNVRYVKIYDVKPEVVYIGYTPGYTGCYVAGPTVVYGTGYAYIPFYGANYYPRPATFGFAMNYNPWIGWSIGFSMAMVTMSVFDAMWYSGGWWGPSFYTPYYGGYYGNYYGYNSYSYYSEYTSVSIQETNIYESWDQEEIENVSDVEGLDEMNYVDNLEDLSDHDADDPNVHDAQNALEDQNAVENQNLQENQDVPADQGVTEDQNDQGNVDVPETPEPPDVPDTPDPPDPD
ncbi:MAG: carbohydrate-binding family V/XII [Bacteroidota bacterium]